MIFRLLYLLNGRRYRTRTAKIKGRRIKLYLADTPLRKTIGLMYWERLRKDEGMLFTFGNDARHAFWMMGMNFPIDMVWLDNSKRITYIVSSARPCKSVFNCPSYAPEKDSRYVLELAAGSARRLRLTIGERISI
ncbi:MAG: DUF192 domain-containing protein [Candidatus Micrarchaeota archaeon]|nr:DUF192 domain-containing protein [Candidatus Micrarchaeota archaeon]